MERSSKERKEKQQATEVSQNWHTTRFVGQMHKFRMPTVFIQFNYVYISLHPVKTSTVGHMQTEWFLPLISVGSSVLVRYAKQLSFSVSVYSFSSRFISLALFLSLSTCKSSRFTQTPAGAVIFLSNVFCCEWEKKEKHGAIVDCVKPGRRERLLLLFTLKRD